MVGVRVIVGVSEIVGVGVREGVSVMVGVGVREGVSVMVGVSVRVGVSVMVRVTVGVRVIVGVRVTVAVEVGVAVKITYESVIVQSPQPGNVNVKVTVNKPLKVELLKSAIQVVRVPLPAMGRSGTEAEVLIGEVVICVPGS
jgi:hypothetical protein